MGRTSTAVGMLGKVVGGLAVAVVLLALVSILPLAFFALLPGSVTVPDDPGYIDNIFGNRWVILIARLALLAFAILLLVGAVYVGASIAVRFGRGQWLQRIGPFEPEIREVAEELIQQDASLEGELSEAVQREQRLRELLTNARSEIAYLREELRRRGVQSNLTDDP